MVTLRRISLAAVLIAFVTAFTASTDAHAQQQDTTDAPAQQQAVGQQTFDNLISALNNVSEEVSALQNVNSQKIQMVNVGDMKANLTETQVQELNTALQNADTGALQDFLSNNDALKGVLSANNVAAADVVAIKGHSGGAATVYYQSNG